MANRWENSGNSGWLYFWGLQNHCRWGLQSWNEKMLSSWKKSYDQPRQHIKKQSHYFVNKGPSAAKSLQSCPTLCDPIDGSPPGFPVPGPLQSRTLEWIAISFSSAWNWKLNVKSLSCVWLLRTPWTAASQAPPSMGFSRQEYWSGVPLPSPKVHLVKSIIFLVVMYGCESWTIKKAVCWRTDAFEQWCWRKLLRVLWIARRSNQSWRSVLKEISPDCSLKVLRLKVKL